ncbi:hypothetical protein QFC19_008174 [Naganishia cerealis]|uniref:Uncharacterized protein n=1 Tax=Naganishia cerealis TaxID=610337 RepID=A0ACC2V5E3_9TREE|nr:hypothetical protein QFC19_008174 [Naganishia cerealis]
MVRDIRKTYDLIKFIGCETHHDMLVALRMLAPYLDTCAEQEQERRSYSSGTDKAIDGMLTDGSYPIRHLPAGPHVAEKTMCDVLDMYIAAKLARRRKTKNPERERMEVGDKLRVLENEFSENTAILRIFEIARLRHSLPDRHDDLRMVTRGSQLSSVSTDDSQFSDMKTSSFRSGKLPSNGKLRLGSFGWRRGTVPIENGNSMHQQGATLEPRSIYNESVFPTSKEDTLLREPSRDPKAHSTSALQDASTTHVDLSNTPVTRSESSNQRSFCYLAQTPLTATELESPGKVPQNKVNVAQPDMTAQVLRELPRPGTDRRRRIADLPPGPRETSRIWRDGPLGSDSEEDIADQLFWKGGEAEKNNTLHDVPVINYSRPRYPNRGGGDLSLPYVSSKTRVGDVSTRRAGAHMNPALSPLPPSPGTYDEGTPRFSDSQADWELFVFSDQSTLVDDLEGTEEQSPVPFPNQPGHDQRNKLHGIPRQSMDSGPLHKAARRESTVWIGN